MLDIIKWTTVFGSIHIYFEVLPQTVPTKQKSNKQKKYFFIIYKQSVLSSLTKILLLQPLDSYCLFHKVLAPKNRIEYNLIWIVRGQLKQPEVFPEGNVNIYCC